MLLLWSSNSLVAELKRKRTAIAMSVYLLHGRIGYILSTVTCWVLGTMVNQMKNQTVDIEILIYQNTQCISI